MRTSIVRHFFPALLLVSMGGALVAAQGPGMGTGPGFAQHRPPFEQAFRGHGRWWNSPRMIERLKLTDDQRNQMDQILFAHREKLIDLQANLQKAELAMQPLMSADQPDRAAMEAQIDKIVQARSELERANARFLLDIRMKLTPEQWKSLKNGQGNGMQDRPGPGQGRRWQRQGAPGGAPPPDNPSGAPAPQQPQGSGGGAEQ